MLLCNVLAACSQETGSSKIQITPTLTFTTLGGQRFDFASLKGQVTLVNFWATSCTTCVHEMPMLVDQFNRHHKSGYRHIAVAMDYDPLAFVQNFSLERGLPFEVVHDTDGSIAKAFGDVKLTPTSFLIDRNGNIVKRYVGEPKEAELTSAIESLLHRS
jgi:peroxiredoxin